MGMSGDFEMAVSTTGFITHHAGLERCMEPQVHLPAYWPACLACVQVCFTELTSQMLKQMPFNVRLQIEMGSTNVRVGSTIFGARQYPAKP